MRLLGQYWQKYNFPILMFWYLQQAGGRMRQTCPRSYCGHHPPPGLSSSWGGCQMTFVSSHKGLINWPGLRCLQTCPATDIQGEGNILEMKHRRRMASHRQQHTGVRVGLRDCEWHHLSALCKLSGWPHSQLPQKLNINFFNKFLLSLLRMSQLELFTITSGGVLLSSRT